MAGLAERDGWDLLGVADTPGNAMDLWVALTLAATRTTRVDLAARVALLTPEQLARTGRHVRFGSMTLRAWLEFFLAHEGHHLYVILKRAHGIE